MGEWGRLLIDVREDKEKFYLLVDKMNPLIKKYTRLLYRDSKEDMRSELILALWEAVKKIQYNEDDSSCVVYMSNAIRYKFLELYRKSRKYNDHQLVWENEALSNLLWFEERRINYILFAADLNHILCSYKSKKKRICSSILFEEMSDSEIAKKYQISRQYTNRVRRELYLQIKQLYCT